MKTKLSLLAVLTFAASLYLFIWKGNTPVPGVLNWDLLHHTNLVYKLAEGKINLFPTNITDTFTINSYTPLFHLPFALVYKLTKLDPLVTFWWAELGYYLISVSVSFWIGKKITRSNFGAVLAGILGILIFESNVAYTNLMLLPQTVAGTMGAILLTKFIYRKTSPINPGHFLFWSLLIVAMHYLIGAIYLCSIMVIFLLEIIIKKVPRKLISSLLTLVLVCVFIFGINHQIPLIAKIEAKDFTFTSFDKLSFLYQWYGLIGLVLFIVALLTETSIFFYFALILLTLSLAPLPYGLKSFVLTHYFVVASLAAAAETLVSKVKYRLGKVVITILLCAAFSAVFLSNTVSFLQSSFNGETNSYISPADFQAGQWVKNTYKNKTVFLISDPDTQAVFEATTNVNTQGGAFAREDTIDTLSSVKTITVPEIYYQKLLSIHDSIATADHRDVTLFVMGGRYFTWQRFTEDQKRNYFYEVWTPQKLWAGDLAIITKLAQSPLFKLVYQDSETAIFELN